MLYGSRYVHVSHNYMYIHNSAGADEVAICIYKFSPYKDFFVNPFDVISMQAITTLCTCIYMHVQSCMYMYIHVHCWLKEKHSGTMNLNRFCSWEV